MPAALESRCRTEPSAADVPAGARPAGTSGRSSAQEADRLPVGSRSRGRAL